MNTTHRVVEVIVRLESHAGAASGFPPER